MVKTNLPEAWSSGFFSTSSWFLVLFGTKVHLLFDFLSSVYLFFPIQYFFEGNSRRVGTTPVAGLQVAYLVPLSMSDFVSCHPVNSPLTVNRLTCVNNRILQKWQMWLWDWLVKDVVVSTLVSWSPGSVGSQGCHVMRTLILETDLPVPDMSSNTWNLAYNSTTTLQKAWSHPSELLTDLIPRNQEIKTFLELRCGIFENLLCINEGGIAFRLHVSTPDIQSYFLGEGPRNLHECLWVILWPL